MVVAAIGIFVFMDNQDRANAKRQAVMAVHAGIDFSAYVSPPVKPAPTVQVPLTNGTVLQVRWCPIAWDELGNPVKDARYQDCRLLDFTNKREVVIMPPSIQLGTTDQIAIERDYWTAYKEARHRYPPGDLLASLFVGLLGFPAGLGLWIFYRLIRFAVKG